MKDVILILAPYKGINPAAKWITLPKVGNRLSHVLR